MQKKTFDFSIVFDEMDKMRDEGLGGVETNELHENEDINTLREIVLDVQTPTRVCLVTT